MQEDMQELHAALRELRDAIFEALGLPRFVRWLDGRLR